MKFVNVPHPREKYRIAVGHLSDTGGGSFLIPNDDHTGNMIVEARVLPGWQYVSVSQRDRYPTWPEMERVKRLFFNKGDYVIQIHYGGEVNTDKPPYILHLWRKTRGTIMPMPPVPEP